MFEKTKNVAKGLKEKGTEVFEKSKFYIVFSAGVASSIMVNCLLNKIREPKKFGIQTAIIKDGFSIRTIGKDRFGRVCKKGPWVDCCGKHDKDHLMNNIDAAIKKENGKIYMD